MRFYVSLLAVLIATPVSAAGPNIVDACTRAAQIEFRAEKVTASDVQSFPELSQPRVQMSAAFTVVVEPDAIAKALGAKTLRRTQKVTIRCSFVNATAPFTLTSLSCIDGNCFVGAERLEELKNLLQREGY